MLRLLGVVFALVLAGSSYGQICVNCIKVRVGRPWLVRTPDSSNRIADNYFNEVALSGGGFRGFSANSVTMSMDGAHTWDMGSALTQVLSVGSPGGFDECGRWLNDTYQSGGTLFGFYHAEHTCPYPATHKSMALVTSTDQGHTWSLPGQIILDRDDSGSTETGMGDCTSITDSSYHYLYCLRGSDHETLVARAPLGNPYPGNWVKYYNGAWNGSALSTQDTSIGYYGTSISLWTTPGYEVLLQSEDGSFHGVKMSLSSDHLNFTKINEPIVYQDAYIWGQSSHELLAYPSAVDSADGDRKWSTDFQMWFTWVPPNGTLSANRYLGVRDVSVTLQTTAQSPQVGVEVSRWLNSSDGERWSTTGPVPGNFSSFAYQGGFGYLMTKQLDPSWIKIVDCQSATNWAGHPDHMLTSNACDTSYNLVRTAGWAYPNGTRPANTLPLYRCYDSTLQSHFASNDVNCEGLGTDEFQIGYVLAN